MDLHWRVTLTITVLHSNSTGQAALSPLPPLPPPTLDRRGHLAVCHTLALVADSQSASGQDTFRSGGQGCQQVHTFRVIVSTTPHGSTLILQYIYQNGNVINQEWEWNTPGMGIGLHPKWEWD